MECTRQPCERESGDGPVAGGLDSLTGPSVGWKCSLSLMDCGLQCSFVLLNNWKLSRADLHCCVSFRCRAQ